MSMSCYRSFFSGAQGTATLIHTKKSHTEVPSHAVDYCTKKHWKADVSAAGISKHCTPIYATGTSGVQKLQRTSSEYIPWCMLVPKTSSGHW